MNLANRIKETSQLLTKTKDPEEKERLEVELADLQDQMDELTEEENSRYDWS